MQDILVNEFKKKNTEFKNKKDLDVANNTLDPAFRKAFSNEKFSIQMGSSSVVKNAYGLSFAVSEALLNSWVIHLEKIQELENLCLPFGSQMDLPSYAKLRPSQRKEILLVLHKRIAKKKKRESDGILKFLAQFTAAANSESGKILSDRSQELPEKSKTPFGLVLEEFKELRKTQEQNEHKPVEKLIGQQNDIREQNCEPKKMHMLMRKPGCFSNLSTARAYSKDTLNTTPNGAILKLNRNLFRTELKPRKNSTSDNNMEDKIEKSMYDLDKESKTRIFDNLKNSFENTRNSKSIPKFFKLQKSQNELSILNKHASFMGTQMYSTTNKNRPMTQKRNTVAIVENTKSNMSQVKQPKLFGNKMGSRTSNSRLTLIMNQNIEQKSYSRNSIVKQEDNSHKKIANIESSISANINTDQQKHEMNNLDSNHDDTMRTSYIKKILPELNCITTQQQNIRITTNPDYTSIIQMTPHNNTEKIVKEEEKILQKISGNKEPKPSFLDENANTSRMVRKHKNGIFTNMVRNDGNTYNYSIFHNSIRERPKTIRIPMGDSNTSTTNNTNHIINNLISNAANNNKNDHNKSVRTKIFEQSINSDRVHTFNQSKIIRKEPCKVGMGNSSIIYNGKEKHIKDANILTKRPSELFIAPKTICDGTLKMNPQENTRPSAIYMKPLNKHSSFSERKNLSILYRRNSAENHCPKTKQDSFRNVIPIPIGKINNSVDINSFFKKSPKKNKIIESVRKTNRDTISIGPSNMNKKTTMII